MYTTFISRKRKKKVKTTCNKIEKNIDNSQTHEIHSRHQKECSSLSRYLKFKKKVKYKLACSRSHKGNYYHCHHSSSKISSDIPNKKRGLKKVIYEVIQALEVEVFNFQL